jgi:hypothetical protein
MMIAISKRGIIRGLATVSTCAWTQSLTFAQNRDPYDFVQPMTGWKAISGDWAFQDVPGAKDGRALVQRATEKRSTSSCKLARELAACLIQIAHKPNNRPS